MSAFSPRTGKIRGKLHCLFISLILYTFLSFFSFFFNFKYNVIMKQKEAEYCLPFWVCQAKPGN